MEAFTNREAGGMSTEEWRRAHRGRMAAFRMRRRLERKCLRCRLPVKTNPRTGDPMSMCPDHLAEDKARVSKAKRKAKKARRR